MTKKVYGVYETNAEVISAINALKAKGFEGEDITVVADKEESLDFTNTQRETDVQTITNERNDDTFMDKVARFFMPDENENLSTRLADAGLSNTEAAEYVYDVERGKMLILVDEGKGFTPTEGSTYAAGEILDTNSTNPLFSGKETNARMTDHDTTILNGQGRGTTEDEKTIRLREEQLKIDKERVQTGEVVLDKEVNEELKTINVPVEREEVTIERRPVTEMNEREAGNIEEGETVRIPVVEEKLEVTKKPVVTDEIVIKKEVVQETEQVQDTLKKEDIELNSSNPSIVHDKNVDRNVQDKKEGVTALGQTDVRTTYDENDRETLRESQDSPIAKKKSEGETNKDYAFNKTYTVMDKDYPNTDATEKKFVERKNEDLLDEHSKIR